MNDNQAGSRPKCFKLLTRSVGTPDRNRTDNWPLGGARYIHLTTGASFSQAPYAENPHTERKLLLIESADKLHRIYAYAGAHCRRHDA